MKTSLNRIFLLMALLCAAILPARAQEDYRFEAGAGLGISGYIGDANPYNLYRYPGFDGELIFRYIANPRIALKTNFYFVTMSGTTKGLPNVMPLFKNYKFNTQLYELGEMFEFNFFKFGMGEKYRKLSRWTPYIAGGLSLVLWNANGQINFSMAIPVGLGVKFKLMERLNLGAEFLMKKTISDRLDGKELDTPTKIQSSFFKNTDWYSTLTVSITYEFSKRCGVCNYKK